MNARRRQAKLALTTLLTAVGFTLAAAPPCAQILHATGPLPTFEVATI